VTNNYHSPPRLTGTIRRVTGNLSALQEGRCDQS